MNVELGLGIESRVGIGRCVSSSNQGWESGLELSSGVNVDVRSQIRVECLILDRGQVMSGSQTIFNIIIIFFILHLNALGSIFTLQSLVSNFVSISNKISFYKFVSLSTNWFLVEEQNNNF